MKYMGHKGRIVPAITKQVERMAGDAHALCDAFCGSGVVAWNLAEQFEIPVLAGDLQSFAAARAAAVVTRSAPLNDLAFVERWISRAAALALEIEQDLRIPPAPGLEMRYKFIAPRKAVNRTRTYAARTLAKLLTRNGHRWPITLAYAGYYYSLEQALTLDSLRATLPRNRAERTVAISALIGAASRCSASPGHTAQPFGIGKKSLPHLVEAWNRSVPEYVREEVRAIAPRHARVEGEIMVGSWERLIDCLSPGDVVFCDPPYSDVQYSRFYHVLETLTRSEVISVSGSGRNPPFEQRPESDFSRKSKSMEELEKLLREAADRGLKLVITFPVSQQSNGLSAHMFASRAKRYFTNVDNDEVRSTFSSLGGNGSNGQRPAREETVEHIICCY
ncbi:MAG: DNA adenine methylase [Betaproteobacteria bacterium]|nr:DNA adenine methylase [Betaproteobacteria bacterium]